MLELLIWIILYSILTGIVVMVRYWYALFQDKDRYRRSELIDFPTILTDEFLAFLKKPDIMYSAMALGAGIAVAWLLALFGGLVSPGTARIPDFASNEMPNYFFQSALSILIFHLAWPSFKELAEPGTPVHKFVKSEVAFFMGLAPGLAAMNLMVWGVHHDISFMYMVINLWICLLYAGFRLQQHRMQYDTEDGMPLYEDDLTDADHEDSSSSDHYNMDSSSDTESPISDYDIELSSTENQSDLDHEQSPHNSPQEELENREY